MDGDEGGTRDGGEGGGEGRGDGGRFLSRSLPPLSSGPRPKKKEEVIKTEK